MNLESRDPAPGPQAWLALQLHQHSSLRCHSHGSWADKLLEVNHAVWCIRGKHNTDGKIKRTHKSRTAKLLFVNRLHTAQFIAPLIGVVLRLSYGVKTRFQIAKKFHSLHICCFLKPGFTLKKKKKSSGLHLSKIKK